MGRQTLKKPFTFLRFHHRRPAFLNLLIFSKTCFFFTFYLLTRLIRYLCRWRVPSTWKLQLYIAFPLSKVYANWTDHIFLISKMSHRKVYSQGSIPFSWEDTPGVCKVTGHQDFRPINITTLHALQLTSSQSPISDMKIPLPPCPLLQPPRRSTSLKGHELQEDPFLVAYKECTKSVETCHKQPPPQIKKGNTNIGFKLWKGKSIFSCKNSCGVTDQGNILKLSQLPPLPKFNASVSRRPTGEITKVFMATKVRTKSSGY